MTVPNETTIPGGSVTTDLPPERVPGSPSTLAKRTWCDHLDRQYAIYREYLEHEDDLINHRATWHATWQGLLFAALGIIIHWAPQDNNGNLVFVVLKMVLPFTGIVVAIVGFYNIRAAVHAMKTLEKAWVEEVAPTYGVASLLPIVPALAGGASKSSEHWDIPNLFIPVVVAAMWSLVGVATVWQWKVNPTSNPERVVIENLGDLTNQEKRFRELNDKLAGIETQIGDLRKARSITAGGLKSRRPKKSEP